MTRSNRVRPFLSACLRPLLNIAVWTAGACLLPALVSAQYDARYGERQPPSVPSDSRSDPRSDPRSNQRLATPQDWSDAVPAHVAVVAGDAQLEREGSVEALDENMPLLAGDRIRSDRGRVEILFADGSVLDLDEYTSVVFLSDDLLRLDEGRLRLLIARAGDTRYRVDGAGVTAWLRSAGEYRLAVVDGQGLDPELRLGVLRGSAELESPFGRTAVRAGDETATSARTAPSLPYATIASSRDAFDHWIDDQYDDRAGTRSISAQYLPADLRYYGSAFDRDGSWLYEPSYGYVWYPRVTSAWQPYYDGRWTFAGAFGWTWVGAGRWTWPTHHYGRWGNASGRWYWIPDRRWAPAWVSWGGSPGYVSWCPLGHDNRPVASITSITAYTSGPNHGWTVVPSRAFGRSFAVRGYAVNGRSLPATERFAARGVGPSRPSSARADLQPLRGPSLLSRSYAVPRAADASTPSAGVGRGRSADVDRPAPSGWPAPSRVILPRSTPRTEPPSSSRTAPSSGDRPSEPAHPRQAGPRPEPAPSHPAARPEYRRPAERESRPSLPAPQPTPSGNPDPPSRGVGRRPSETPRQEPAPPPRSGGDAGGAPSAPREGGDRGRAHARERR